jgi:hypothetical protein
MHPVLVNKTAVETLMHDRECQAFPILRQTLLLLMRVIPALADAELHHFIYVPFSVPCSVQSACQVVV